MYNVYDYVRGNERRDAMRYIFYGKIYDEKLEQEAINQMWQL